MNPDQKAIFITALKNGIFWSAVLLLLTYFKNRIVYLNYLPFWFVFFAITGALRKYYLIHKQRK